MARSLPCTALLLAVLTSADAALAAEIEVLTARAYKPVAVALAPAFAQSTGHRLVVDNDTASALVRRIGAGEADIGIHQISEILAVPGAAVLKDKGLEAP